MIFEINVSRVDGLVMGDYDTDNTKEMYYTKKYTIFTSTSYIYIDLNQYLLLLNNSLVQIFVV